MKYFDGTNYVEMTEEEEREYMESLEEESTTPTPEDRIAQLETELAELKAIIEGGDVNV